MTRVLAINRTRRIRVLDEEPGSKGDILAAAEGGDFGRVPVSGTDGRVLTERSTAPNGVAWETPVEGISAFTDLSDVPASYVGQTGKLAAVKSDESGLEFIEKPMAVAADFEAVSTIGQGTTRYMGVRGAVAVSINSGIGSQVLPAGRYKQIIFHSYSNTLNVVANVTLLVNGLPTAVVLQIPIAATDADGNLFDVLVNGAQRYGNIEVVCASGSGNINVPSFRVMYEPL